MRGLAVNPLNPTAPPIRILSQVRLGTVPFQHYCYNCDFANGTGQIVDDLHIWLDGPAVLADVYTGPLNPFGWPDPRAGYDPTVQRYHLFWSGVDVAPGAEVHVGFCSDRPLSAFRSPAGSGLPPIYWTKDGVPVLPPIAVPTIEWTWAPGGDLAVTLSLDPGFLPQTVGVVEIAPLPLPPVPPIPPGPPVDLDLLTYGNLGAMTLVWQPLTPAGGALAPGGSLVFTPPAGLIDPALPTQAFAIRYQASPSVMATGGALPGQRTSIPPAGALVAGELVYQPSAGPNGTASRVPPTTISLRWPEVAGAAGYEVWRSTTPYAKPGAAGTSLVGTGTPDGAGHWTQIDAASNLGNANLHTYYTIVAYNSAGQPSAQRSYDGEFEFGLTAGTP